MHTYCYNYYLYSQLRTFTETAGKYTPLYQFNNIHPINLDATFEHVLWEKPKTQEGTLRFAQLKKLRRLAIFMEELSGASNCAFGEKYNCKERYFELFPDVSERTRMRDYEILAGIGYTIRWGEYEQSHKVQGYLYQIRDKF